MALCKIVFWLIDWLIDLLKDFQGRAAERFQNGRGTFIPPFEFWVSLFFIVFWIPAKFLRLFRSSTLTPHSLSFESVESLRILLKGVKGSRPPFKEKFRIITAQKLRFNIFRECVRVVYFQNSFHQNVEQDFSEGRYQQLAV